MKVIASGALKAEPGSLSGGSVHAGGAEAEGKGFDSLAANGQASFGAGLRSLLASLGLADGAKSRFESNGKSMDGSVEAGEGSEPGASAPANSANAGDSTMRLRQEPGVECGAQCESGRVSLNLAEVSVNPAQSASDGSAKAAIKSEGKHLPAASATQSAVATHTSHRKRLVDPVESSGSRAIATAAPEANQAGVAGLASVTATLDSVASIADAAKGKTAAATILSAPAAPDGPSDSQMEQQASRAHRVGLEGAGRIGPGRREELPIGSAMSGPGGPAAENGEAAGAAPGRSGDSLKASRSEGGQALRVDRDQGGLMPSAAGAEGDEIDQALPLQGADSPAVAPVESKPHNPGVGKATAAQEVVRMAHAPGKELEAHRGSAPAGGEPVESGAGLSAMVREQAREGETGNRTSGSSKSSADVPLAGGGFSALDKEGAPERSVWIHAGRHQAEAGFEDPAVGWIGVRADMSGGGIRAELVPGSADAARVLGSHLAGLNAYLADHHASVESLTLGQPGGGSMGFGGEASTEQGMQRGRDQQPDEDRRVDAALSVGKVESTAAGVAAMTAPQGSGETMAVASGRGAGGYHISVLA